MRRWTIINVLLGLIVLLLAIEVARTWARALPPVEVVTRASVPSPDGEKRPKGGKRGAQEPRGELPPPAMVASIAQKDLFDPSRQAATEEAAAPVAKVTEPPPNVTVTGVRIFGKDSEVFVTDASQGNQQKRLRVGDQVGGYTVKGIDPTGLTLASPSGDEVTMSLAIEKGKTPPATPGRPGVAARTPPGGQTPPPSPAAGPQGASPAAGVPVKPATGVQTLAPKPPPIQPVPAVTPPGTPGAPGQIPPPSANLPADVQQKLEQLRHREPRSRAGRSP